MIEWYYAVLLVIYFGVFSAGFVLHLIFDGWSWGGGAVKEGWLVGLVIMALWPLFPLAGAVGWLIDKTGGGKP